MVVRNRWSLVAWLVVLLAGQTAAFVVVWRFFVHTQHGQLLDAIALAGDAIGRYRIAGLVGTVLNVISVLSLAVATAVIGFIALIRRRIMLAFVAMLVVGGANLTTQVIKHGVGRPDFGADGTGALAAYGNSLPSGHATVAASVAAALVLVLPPRLRGLGGLLGAGYAAVTGMATLSAGWHRPSDAVAAMLAVGGWAAFAGILLVLAAGPDRQHERDSNAVAASALVSVGLLLLAVYAVALKLTGRVLFMPPAQISTARLFAAYAGSAAGIAGTAGVVIGLLLATVHGVVPGRHEWALVPAEDVDPAVEQRVNLGASPRVRQFSPSILGRFRRRGYRHAHKDSRYAARPVVVAGEVASSATTTARSATRWHSGRSARAIPTADREGR